MSATQPYLVLRAIFVDGQRIEPGQRAFLTAQQAVELAAAGRVERSPCEAPPGVERAPVRPRRVAKVG